MVAQAKTRVTFAEYAAMPETNQIVELIDGEIVRETVVTLSPYAHQETLSKVKSYLVNELKMGSVYNLTGSLIFEYGNSFEPDLFWISPENDHCYLEDDGRCWHGAPDLVIEILSPSTASNDRGSKFDTYEKMVCANTGWSILMPNLPRFTAMMAADLSARVCSSRINRLSRRYWAAQLSTARIGKLSRNTI